MEKTYDLLTIIWFILSIGLFGYGLKKIVLKTQKKTSKD